MGELATLGERGRRGLATPASLAPFARPRVRAGDAAAEGRRGMTGASSESRLLDAENVAERLGMSARCSWPRPTPVDFRTIASHAYARA
jgi:hypothetical protein